MISIMRPSTEKWGGVLEISLKEENSYWLISFKDTGVGMDKDTQLKMFDSFLQRRIRAPEPDWDWRWYFQLYPSIAGVFR